MPLSSLKRGFGAAALLVLGATPALPGCYSVSSDDDPECDRDSDCDDDEFCNEDDECQSACSQYCDTSSSCAQLSITEAECRNGCGVLIGENAACNDAMLGLAKCWEGYSSCNDALVECTATFDAMYAACIPPCNWTNDGTCDEATGICAYGTDLVDCGDNSCTYRYDGACDEGTYCGVGTDTYDCGAG
jgi:hypothetical protein